MNLRPGFGQAPSANRLLVFLAIVATACALGCRNDDRRKSPPAAVSVTRATAKPRPEPMVVPRTFVGEVSCADCAGIRTTLTLRPDGLFFLRNVHRAESGDRVRVFTTLGSWEEAPYAGELVLKNDFEPARHLQLLSGHRLKNLQSKSRELRSALPDELKPVPQVDDFREPFAMQGMVVYIGEAGRFRECTSGRTWPIAREGGNAALERAYGATPAIVGEPLLADVDAHLALRPKIRGQAMEEVVVVDRYDRIRAAADCSTEP